MLRKLFVLFVCALLAAQPVLAQGNVITLDLGTATDEELAGALENATGLELIMQNDWETGSTRPAPQPIQTHPAPGGTVTAPDQTAGTENEGNPPADSLQESQRLVDLANQAMEQGDYEAAAAYAEEAKRVAGTSDGSSVAEVQPETQAPTQTESTETPESEGPYPLPATFTVRSWLAYRDSLWTIAGRPEIFGNPFRWPVLFETNKQIMPEPENPNLIEPGMVLEIPSIDGEVREGAWQSGREYQR